MKRRHRPFVVGILASFIGTSAPSVASAQAAPPERSDGWATASTVTAGIAIGTELLMPRIFFADPESTAGWKGRWHVSMLASAMTLTSAALFNEAVLKDALEVRRPGCEEAFLGTDACRNYASLSTHAFAASSALGQGTAVFLVDTLKWSDGNFSAGSFVGHIGVPLVFAGLTSVGRVAGEWESGGTVLASTLAGLATGALTGLTYSLLQRPECPYGQAVICW
jgi:hypothetical protein